MDNILSLPRTMLSATQVWRAIAADDEPDSLLLVVATLQMQGIDVQEASNGQSVLDLLAQMEKTSLPTFIVLDISMPRMDGWQTLAKIKANPNWTHIPIIALTAYAIESERERALTAGFDAYLFKPISPTALIDEIERVLMKRS